MKHIVLAEDDQGGTVAIGPVFTDASVDRIRDRVEAIGWTNLGTARVLSVSNFNTETGK